MEMQEISVLDGVMNNPKKKRKRKRRATATKKSPRRRSVKVYMNPKRRKRPAPMAGILGTIRDGGTVWVGAVATRVLAGIIGERMPELQEKPISNLMEAGIGLGLGIVLANMKQARLGRLATIGGLTRALDGMAMPQLMQLPGFRAGPPAEDMSGYFEEDEIGPLGQFITAEDVTELEGSMGNLTMEEEALMDEVLEEEIL